MSLGIFRFVWDDQNSRFKDPPLGKTGLTELQNHLIKEVISKLESSSGIKKDTYWLRVILFFLIAILGYVAAAFAITY